MISSDIAEKEKGGWVVVVSGGGVGSAVASCLHFFLSVRWLMKGVDHIFTVNKEDAIISYSPSPIEPLGPMHNEPVP